MIVQQIKTISVLDLKKCMDQSVIYLIDVREHYEWQMMRIPSSIHIPKDQLSERIGHYVIDSNQPIYLLCMAGIRSLYAAENLLRLGYQNVYSVDGGLVDWVNHGFPVEK